MLIVPERRWVAAPSKLLRASKLTVGEHLG
jgi:hypothetical protein